MFFYPDPEPIGYCITDVSPSYLTDGVFFNGGSIGPTHKCVAKQLSAIPRGPNDPVAPRAEVNPRTLENWTINSKAWYVDNCGRNAKALHGMMGLLPKEKVDGYAGWKSKVAIFPRSEQYEYRYIQKMRLKNLKNYEIEVELERGADPKYTVPTASAPFEFEKIQNWRQDKEKIQCAVGFPDDDDDDDEGEFQRSDSQAADAENILIRNKKQSFHHLDLKARNVPAAEVIYRQENEDKKNHMVRIKSLQQIHLQQNKADELEVLQICNNQDKSLICNTKDDDDDDDDDDDGGLKKVEAELNPSVVKLDPRWHLWHGVCDVPKNCLDRKNAMLSLHKPYHHEINTWYSKNKPSKLLPTVIFEGKRPILEWHFSNL